MGKKISLGLIILGIVIIISGIAVSASATVLPVPNLSVSLLTNYSEGMFTIKVNGSITNGADGLSGLPIIISASPISSSGVAVLSIFGEDLAASSVTTQNDGSFSFGVSTLSAGNFEIDTYFRGNEFYASASATTYLAIKRIGPVGQGGIFSVTANSPMSELNYDFTSRMLSFQVNGTAEAGQVRAQVSKSLVENVSRVETHLDNNTVTHTLESVEDYWVFSFMQSQSDSGAVVALGAEPPETTSNPFQFNTYQLSFSEICVWIIGPVIFVVISVIFYLKRRKTNTVPLSTGTFQ